MATDRHAAVTRSCDLPHGKAPQPSSALDAQVSGKELYLGLDFRSVAFGRVRAIVSVQPLIRRLA